MSDTAIPTHVETARRAESAAPPAAQQTFARKIYVEAFQALKRGASATEAAQRLAILGVDARSATTIVANVGRFVRDLDAAYRSAGLKAAGIGLLWCVGGILVTAITYQAAAANGGGGTYVVAWGAVLFGGIQAVRGLFHSLRRATQEQLVEAFKL